MSEGIFCDSFTNIGAIISDMVKKEKLNKAEGVVVMDQKTFYFPPAVLYKQKLDTATGIWGVLWMGPNFEQSTGFEYGEFKHDRTFWAERLHPKDKLEVFEKLAQLERGNIEAIEMTYRWLHKDATYHWFIDCASHIKATDNSTSEIIGSWVDISVHANAAKIIAENEEHYKKIVEFSPHALFVHNDGAFRFLNTAAVKLFGCKHMEEIIGKPLLNFIHPDYHDQVRQQISAVVTENINTPLVPYKIITLDGEVRDVEIASSPFVYQGKRSVQGVIVDVTKLKLVEDLYRTNTAELEHLNKILMKRDAKHVQRGETVTTASFDQENGVLHVGASEIKIQKFSRQYGLLRVIFQDEDATHNDWQFSEISELMDAEARFDWKKLYNIADAIRKNIAVETGIKDFFILTTQSLKVNPTYLSNQ